MSQNNNFSSVNKTSSFDNDAVEISARPTTLLSTSPDTFSDSNDDWKSVDDNNDLVIDKTQGDYGWASFGTNEDKANSTSKVNQFFHWDCRSYLHWNFVQKRVHLFLMQSKSLLLLLFYC